jgi:hypothetical protein
MPEFAGEDTSCHEMVDVLGFLVAENVIVRGVETSLQ